jgi:carbon-monoxide dehydrogenase small subunit
MLAVQCDGAAVETIEGLSDSGEIADLQSAFEQRNALQCGFCTPGMLAAAQDLLKRGGVPSRDDIRAHLSGNYCRCTGYHAIVDAVEAVAKARASTSSFRGASTASEPGIQPRNMPLDSGSGASHRPGMTKVANS